MKKFFLVALIAMIVWLFFHEENEVPVGDSESLPHKISGTKVSQESKAEASAEIPVSRKDKVPAEKVTPTANAEAVFESDSIPKKSELLEMPTEKISEILKKSEKSFEVTPGAGYFTPGCFTGEYYPYVGKPDRMEVELFWPASGESAGGPQDPDGPHTERPWKSYSDSYLVIKKVGEIVRDLGPENFRKPEKTKDGTYGYLIVDSDKAIYQIAAEKEKLRLTYYEKTGEDWKLLTTALLTRSNGPACNSHGHNF
ncbi:MAG: hypothetical protein ACJ76H_15435 [Bacteriovoracaceae bacterium]